MALSINLIICTIRHWRRLPVSVLFIHIGILFILFGGILGKLGFIATINIYEGDSTSSAYRWDCEEERPLGFSLMVKRINQEYYPTSVRVGVLVDGVPSELCELTTGGSTVCAGLLIEALTLDPTFPSLTFAVTPSRGGHREVITITTKDRGIEGTAFQLVAFKTPAVKRTWVDLAITSQGVPLATGQAEVNHPFIWQGYRFFHTANGTDPTGRTYAGIQIVKDLGVPLVYLGFALLTVGNLLFFIKKMSAHRRNH